MNIRRTLVAWPPIGAVSTLFGGFAYPAKAPCVDEKVPAPPLSVATLIGEPAATPVGKFRLTLTALAAQARTQPGSAQGLVDERVADTYVQLTPG